jgi:hypothetical protein
LNGAAGDQTKVEDLIPEALERLYQSSSLLYLRILAFVPACWGTLVLSHGVITGGVYHDVWPWGADFSSEAMYRRSHGSFLDEGLWKPAVRGDLILSIAWVGLALLSMSNQADSIGNLDWSLLFPIHDRSHISMEIIL